MQYIVTTILYRIIRYNILLFCFRLFSFCRLVYLFEKDKHIDAKTANTDGRQTVASRYRNRQRVYNIIIYCVGIIITRIRVIYRSNRSRRGHNFTLYGYQPISVYRKTAIVY